MLVLSRKRGEKIQIGSNITITVVHISGDRVRLAFDAPSDVPIHREELRRKLDAEHAAADISRPESPLLADCA